ncbi:MAG: hypothetical protein D6801_05490 [Alphaproteobacteria bacterium]|nr:MAG: hypothetical protein D6801_05490 [Alphaproteobacteria bacterium]
MKKVLLASTILVGTAGFAAADTANFSFSGAASFGFAYSNLAGGTGTPTVSSEFTAAMSSTTDGGLNFGSSITVSSASRGMDDDNTTTTFGTVTTSGSSISDANAYVSGDWGKFSVSYDANVAGITTDDNVTFAYSNTWGDFTVDAAYSWMPGAGNDTASLGGTYSMGAYSVYATLNMDEVGGWGLDNIDFGGSASMSGFSAGVDANYDLVTKDLTWKATAGYGTGAWSLGVFVEDDDTLNGVDFGANGSYDLGGGMNISAALIRDNDLKLYVAEASVGMSF